MINEKDDDDDDDGKPTMEGKQKNTHTHDVYTHRHCLEKKIEFPPAEEINILATADNKNGQ